MLGFLWLHLTQLLGTKSGLRETRLLVSIKTRQHSSLPRQVLVTGKTRPRQDLNLGQVRPFSVIQETCYWGLLVQTKTK